MKLWLAKDEDGYSQLYVEKPIKMNGYFERVPNTGWFTISCKLFPEVTFENSPQEIELKLWSDHQKEINKMKKLYYELHNNDLLKNVSTIKINFVSYVNSVYNDKLN